MKTVYLFLLLTVASLCSCHRGGTTADLGSFNDTIYQPQSAKGFALLTDSVGSATLLRINSPWQGGADAVNYLLMTTGDEDVAAGSDACVLRGEAKRIVAMSSTFVAMLERLGEADRIVGVSGLDYINSPAINARRDEIADVGYSGNIDYERLVAAKPDLVMLYGVTGADQMEPKLRELGIPYVYIGDYLEESPVGKAEWLVAIGAIVGCRERAEAIYGEIAARYDALRSSVATTGSRPKVMINAPYGDAWFMPSTGSYMVRLIEDAGGSYVYPDNTSDASVSIDMEVAYKLACEADIWLNPGQATTIDQLLQALPRFGAVKSVKTERVYNNNARLTPSGGNDFYESATVNPDVVLADLVKIMQGTADADSLTYYRPLQ